MFWRKKKVKRHFEYPFSFLVTINNVNDLIRVQFLSPVGISFLYLRSIPTNGGMHVFSDEYGPRNISNEINAINLESVTAVIGAPTISRAINTTFLNASFNLVFFNSYIWRVRNLFFQGTVTGQYLICVNYSILPN